MLQRLKTTCHIEQLALTPGAASQLEKVPNDLLIGNAREILRAYWQSGGLLIVVGALGAVTRLIAPLIGEKETDPAVLVIDARALNIVPLLGGHKAGGENLAFQLAEDLGSNAVVTSDSFGQGRIPLDSFGEAWGWIRSGSSASWRQLIVNHAKGNKLTVSQSSGSDLWQKCQRDELYLFEESLEAGFSENNQLIISSKISDKCNWHPATLWIGIGCARNTSQSLLERSLFNYLLEGNLARESIAGLASIQLKDNEEALISIADKYGWPIRFFSAEELSRVSVPNPSDLVNSVVGSSSVAEASAILASGEKGLLLKQKKIFLAENNELGSATIAISEASQPFAPKKGELHLIGSGPGSLSLLTHDARSALARCAIWIGYERYLDLLEPLRRKDQVRVNSKLTFEYDRCSKAFDLARQGVRVALISSGDSGIYGMAGLALEICLAQPLNERPLFQIHPGISAFQLAAAKSGVPMMNDFCTISLSDLLTPWEKIEERILGAASGDFVIAIYNPKSKNRDWQLQKTIDILKQYRSEKTPVLLARQMGRTGETFNTYELGRFPFDKVDMLTILIIGNNQSLYRDGYFFTPRGYSIS